MRPSILLFVSFVLLGLSVGVVSVTGRAFQRNHDSPLNHRLNHGVDDSSTWLLKDIQPQWLTQKLDHQDLTSTATFQQQYFVNDQYFNKVQPIVFLMIGGEGPISPAYVSGHFNIGPLAERFGALQVALEHRFYGESVPNNDSSTANLKYLSSAQALQDLVTLHQVITQQYGQAKWVVFGGSYSGSLSAWARLKYPNLFVGSIASSAPVQAQLDFPQYFEVVAQSVGSNCSNLIKAAQQEINNLLQTSNGIGKLVQAFNICTPMVTPNDIANFQSAVSGPFAETVQYNDDAGRTAFDIKTICNLMSNEPDPLAGLLDVWNAYNTNSGQSGCTDVNYDNYILSMLETSAGRSWTWQTCIEFGYFQTGESSAQPFSPDISLEFFTQQCVDIFGIENLLPQIKYINDFYGGWNIVTSNTVFTNGDVDPWHKLGNYQTYTPAAASDCILMHGTAHCADLYAPNGADLPDLIRARNTQEAWIQLWISKGN